MANKTIGELTEAGTLDGTELVHVVQGGNSRKSTTGDISAGILVDEDDMASDSATKAPSQQSVKAYVDAGDATQLGVGQTWQDVTASRDVSTNYTNTTGRTIFVVINTPTGSPITLTVDGLNFYANYLAGSSQPRGSVSVPVPAGSVYSLSSTGAYTWLELR